MNKSLLILTIGFLTLLGSRSYGQKITRVENPPVVCQADPRNIPTRVEVPEAFKNRSSARTATTTIEVVYGEGFTPQAQAAFQLAVDIWASLISSPVTIRISASWVPLAPGVLGSCGPGFYARDFDGAPKINVDYPGALAERLAGKELNGSDEFDIVARFSSTFNWYFNPTGTPGAGLYDLTTVVLHEMGHGLGFTGSYGYGSGIGGYSGPVPYDLNLETLSGINLYQNFISPSAQLGGLLVSNNLFINSQLAVSNNSGQRPKIYAPTTWEGGSSIAHLDEATYPAANINSLMSPQIGAQEVIHDPGPITKGMFRDIGWTTTYINHEPISNTENLSSPAFDVVASITPDNTPSYGINAGTIYLHYYTSDDPTIVSVSMTTTGNPDEYTAQLPAPGGNALDYYYYISVDDNLNRTITKPGKVITPLQAPTQGFFKFHVGPDTEAPVITHTPADYFSFINSQLVAKVVEQFDLASVEVEYTVAGVPQSNAVMTIIESLTNKNPLTGLTTRYYEVTIPTASIVHGDEIAYRIVATDNSSNSNSATEPSGDFHTFSFISAKPTEITYVNNFDLASDDFFGRDGDFSITQPGGFSNPAIHSVHPYVEASSLDLNDFSYIYTLRVPILVQGIGATVKFEEIVLVEPGESGAIFPNSDFYDYVVTEGSVDGGKTWTPLADGYDSRDYSPWLTKYNSSPTAVGDPSLYRTRKLKLLDNFNEGDEVLLRFRLFTDFGAAGWGWAIDNLRIQIDDEAPEILHQHLDYIKSNATSFIIKSDVTDYDDISVDNFVLEIGVNESPTQFFEEAVGVNAAEVTYTFDDLTGLSAGDKIIYRLISNDVNGNSKTIPEEGYFEVPFLEFESAVDQYTNNFNSASDDFVGNFFSIDQPAGFSDGAIHSSHDYLTGFGPDHVSDFTYTLKKPITLSDRNANIRLDEIAIVEGHANGAVFGTPAFQDYVVIEGSKDGGETWKEFFDGYDAVGQSAWVNAFSSGTDGTPAMFKTRTFSMTKNGDFEANDEVIIRFRLSSNETLNGWGWAIDNLYIQDPITTATEKELELSLSVYPNPVKEKIIVEASGLASPWFNVQLLNAQGQPLYTGQSESLNGNLSHSIPASTLAKGVYFVKVFNGEGASIRKVIKID